MAKKEDKKNSVGRPTKYSEELADRICEAIANSNRGLVTICKQEGMPTRSTVHKWISENKQFSDKYAKAREDQADYLAEEMLEIADNSTNDTTLNRMGEEIENREWVNRSRLRVDTRKFIASKLKPKKYGDKLDLTTDGEKIQTPILIDWTTKDSTQEDQPNP
jgi:transposase-like protein